jgi:hypothetical protein
MTGKNAGGVTLQEFMDHVKGALDAWRACEAKLLPSERCGEHPVLSWDNCAQHGQVLADTSSRWANFGITAVDHTLLPEYSGDMHNVIEGVHAQLMQHMRPAINNMTDDTLPPYIAKLEEIFKTKVTAKSIRARVTRLHTVTLPAIMEKGGDWPEHQKR